MSRTNTVYCAICCAPRKPMGLELLLDLVVQEATATLLNCEARTIVRKEESLGTREIEWEQID